jgi:Spy/CpxP family protein refolding chaperone
MKNLWRMVWVGGLAVIVAAAPVYGQHGGQMGRGSMGGPGLGMMLPMVLRAVNLTPEQETQVREILKAHRPAFRAFWEQLRAVQEEIADKLFAPGTVQVEDLAPQLQRIAQLRQQMLQESLKASLEMRALLTPEQLAKASQLKDGLRALRNEERRLLEGVQ